MEEFDFSMEYKLGKANILADALSRKAELAAITSAKGDILSYIREVLSQDLSQNF